MKYFLLCCFLSGVLLANAQRIPDIGMKNADKIDVPFELENNFIIISVIFNRVFPLKFIVDTGAEYTILTHKEITDLLQIDYHREFPILGADMKTELKGYLARGIDLQIGGMLASQRTILVLDDDYFRFNELAGIEVHGILGADLLRRFVVRINYQKKVITFFDPGHFPEPRQATVLPIDVYRNKPYINVDVGMQEKNLDSLKMLIDTGASLALLVHTGTLPGFETPANVVPGNIGMGLGGFLEGYNGRMDFLDIGPHRLRGVITNFQDFLPGANPELINQRNGIVGNQVLERFNVTFDYIREKLYLVPNRHFNDRFRFDKSGMALVASGVRLGEIVVLSVIPGSPADEVGILPGDHIKTFNGFSTRLFSLGDIVYRLSGRTGKRIRLNIIRDEVKFKVTFRLRDLI
ncbi:MAG: aspartyl protease family protein [Lewinellaceae bacterium]|nr:aspartyl protease family protein [Lewinellaceae bacterium]